MQTATEKALVLGAITVFPMRDIEESVSAS
jgi:hypothetical protein